MFASMRALACGVALFAGLSLPALAAESKQPSAQQALALLPVQEDVDFDKPATADKCKVEAEGKKGESGWTVRNDAGVILRRFLDTNGDNKVDQWCYYKDGVEVYRDVDSNFNGKADQCRWLGTAGIRWGLDRDEDGRIDAWKAISPEEVSSEAVAAFRERDVLRFKRLLLTATELKELGQSVDQSDKLARRVNAAAAGFTEIAKQQTLVGAKAQWLHFVAHRPGILPAGANGSSRDLVLYENTIAVLDNEGKTNQLQLGTLVRVGDTWRLLDLPTGLAAGQPEPGEMNLLAPGRKPDSAPVASAAIPSGISEKAQKLVQQLEAIDKQLAAPDAGEKMAKLQAQRGEVLEQLVLQAGTPEEKSNWVHQLADSMSAAVQSGQYPEGAARLKAIADKLGKDEPKGDLTAYVMFRYLTSSYALNIGSAKGDSAFAKVQEKWNSDLEKFVSDYPRSPDAAEALLQLAIAQEFAGKEDEARRLYAQIVRDFSKAPIALKAAGAKLRLESVGKNITLAGKTIEGQPFNLAADCQGKVVLIHYWATWCEPCKQDMDTIARLQAKFAKQGFVVVGVNVDSDVNQAKGYLAENRFPWTHLYEEGGLDSRLATDLGVVTLPTMLLLDNKGKVVNRNIHSSELETELGKIVSVGAAAAPGKKVDR